MDKVLLITGSSRGIGAGEVAQAIVWLLSEATSYTTLSLLEVSGAR